MSDGAEESVELATRIERYRTRYSGDWSAATLCVSWEEVDQIVAALRATPPAAPSAKQISDKLADHFPGKQRFRDQAANDILALFPAAPAQSNGDEGDSFEITWRNGAYYVSIPNYQGGTVYTGKHVDTLRDQLAKARGALEEIVNVEIHRTARADISMQDHARAALKDVQS